MSMCLSVCTCVMCAIPVVHKIRGLFRHRKVAERHHLFAVIGRGRG